MDEQLETIRENAEHQGDIHRAVMAERERCAKIAESAYVREKKYHWWGAFWTIETRSATGKDIAEAIRS